MNAERAPAKWWLFVAVFVALIAMLILMANGWLRFGWGFEDEPSPAPRTSPQPATGIALGLHP